MGLIDDLCFSDFFQQVSKIPNVSERLQHELKKIDAFKRELPLCRLLLNHAILAVKEEEKQCRRLYDEPVLEHFIPLKRCCDEEDQSKIEVSKESKDTKDKMDWLTSVQLWNTSHLNQPTQDFTNNRKTTKQDITKRIDDEVQLAVLNDPIKSRLSLSVGIGLLPFKGYSEFPFSAARKEKEEDSPGLSLRTPAIKTITDDILVGGMGSKSSASRSGSSSFLNGRPSVSGGSQLQQQSTRKQRRCWSPDLHRRFIEALLQLGGSQVATPKQIRELMQVDGLTNDEVKSHLQKYRLHARRAPAVSGTVPNQSVGSGDTWSSQDHLCGRTLRLSSSHSDSPPGPLHFGGTSQGTSMTGCDDIHDDDEEKSECYSLKFHAHSSETSNIYKISSINFEDNCWPK